VPGCRQEAGTPFAIWLPVGLALGLPGLATFVGGMTVRLDRR
jgi:hypothetical protein